MDGMLVGDGTVVTFHYTLKDDAGEILDSSVGANPLSYLHGKGAIVPGLEQALTGRAAGGTIDVEVPAAEGYGERREDLVFSLPRQTSPLPEGVGVGSLVELGASDGRRMPAQIVEVRDDVIVLDANHPLAGQDLHFAIEITEVRVATDAEMQCGHVHGPGHSHE